MVSLVNCCVLWKVPLCTVRAEQAHSAWMLEGKAQKPDGPQVKSILQQENLPGITHLRDLMFSTSKSSQFSSCSSRCICI